MSDKDVKTVPTVDELMFALKAEVRGAKAEQKPSYKKVVAGKRTLGFVRSTRRGLSVNVPRGHGEYETVKVTKSAGIPGLVAKMKAVAEAPAPKPKVKSKAKTAGKETIAA